MLGYDTSPAQLTQASLLSEVTRLRTELAAEKASSRGLKSELASARALKSTRFQLNGNFLKSLSVPNETLKTMYAGYAGQQRACRPPNVSKPYSIVQSASGSFATPVSGNSYSYLPLVAAESEAYIPPRDYSNPKPADSQERSVHRVIANESKAGGNATAHSAGSKEHAVEELLGFLHIDPDGGLLNLGTKDELQDDQATKLHVMFNKPRIHQIVGFIMLGRVCVNVPHVLIQSTHTIVCEWSGRCASFSRPDLLSSFTLPLQNLAMVVAGVEIAWMASLICSLIYDACSFACSKDGVDDGRAKKRYYHLSHMFFYTIGYLQNFSAMSCLQYVHPARIGHHMNTLHDTEDAVLHFGRRIFKKGEHDATDEEIQEIFVQVVYQEEIGYRDIEQVMESYCYETSYDLFKKLMRLDEPASHDLIMDPSGFDQAWKVRAVSFVETTVFVLFSCFVLVFGSTAFVVKLCRVSLLLLDDTSPWYWTLWTVIAFINQALGIMAVQHMLRDRILWFLFGGQDARVTIEERSLMLAYEAILAEKVWSVQVEGKTILNKCLALMTFSADDIQRLVLEENPREKQAITQTVRAQLVGVEHQTNCVHHRVSTCIKTGIRGETEEMENDSSVSESPRPSSL